MAISKTKRRILITCSDEQIAKLDSYSKKMGITRSALCTSFIGQGLLSMDKAYCMLDMFAADMSDEMKKAFAVLVDSSSGDGRV